MASAVAPGSDRGPRVPIHSRGTAALVALACLVGASCDGSSQGEADRRVADGPVLSCADVGVGSDAGTPLDPLVLTGLEGFGPGDFVLEARTEAGLGGPVPVLDRPASGNGIEGGGNPPEAAEGPLLAVVPVHPGGRLEGGGVSLRLQAGEVTCPLGELEILPLDPAPGATADLAAAIQDHLAAQSAHFGATPADLVAARPDTLVPPLRPLFVAQFLVDHPDNPNSLAAVLRGDAPYFGSAGADLGLLDALAARAGLVEGVQEVTRRVVPAGERLGLGDPPGGPPGLGGSVFRFASSPLPTPGAAHGAQQEEWGQRLHYCPMADSFYRPDAETLSCWMHLSMNGDFMTSGAPKETWDRFMMTLGVGATLPVPMYREGMVVAQATAFAYQTAAEAAANVLPRTLTRLTVNLGPASFAEDVPGPGRYDPVEITARSNGWNLAATTAQAVWQLFQVGDAARGAYGVLSSWSNAGQRTGEFFSGVAGFLVDQLNSLAQSHALGSGDPGSAFDLPAANFGPTDVTDPEWTEVRIEGAAVQSIGRPAYQPWLTGQARLLVWTQPLKFGDQQLRREFDLEVRDIVVAMVPAARTVEPGESVTFRADVSNAADTRVDWSLEPSGAHTLIVTGEDGLTVDVTTSDDPDDFPIVVTATSIADRSHLYQAPPRLGRAMIQAGVMALEPAVACVEPGASLELSVMEPEVQTGELVLGGADDSGGENYRWSTDQGQVSSRGVYRAPESPGVRTALVTAADDEDPSRTAQATIRIGGCRCWSRISIGDPVGRTVMGFASFTGPGAELQVRLSNSDAALGGMQSVMGGQDPAQHAALSVTLDFGYEGFASGESGTHPLAVAMANVGSPMAGGAYLLGFDPRDERYGRGSGSVHITEHSPTTLTGTFEARLMMPWERDYVPVPVRAEFSAVSGRPTDPDSDLWRCLNDEAR